MEGRQYVQGNLSPSGSHDEWNEIGKQTLLTGSQCKDLPEVLRRLRKIGPGEYRILCAERATIFQAQRHEGPFNLVC